MPLTVAQAFDPRANSIGFLRWLMAFLVIFSHAGPVAGFYGGHDLGVQLSTEQSLGGVAVAGFFFFSGFLITRSRMGRASMGRYFWRRFLRIMPGFWMALLLTVGVFAPLAWRITTGSFSGYLSAPVESPLTYFWNNMFLDLGQRNIAGMGDGLPYAQLHGGHDWNGSAWTLRYEFIAYIVVGFLGLFGALANKVVGVVFAVAIIVLNGLQWTGSVNVANVNVLFVDPYFLMFLAPFAFGMLFTLVGDKIPIDDRLAVGMLVLAFLTYDLGGWNIYGQYAFMYFMMWVAVRVPLRNWEKYGDFSYGIYIYGWPLMTLGTYFGLQNGGWWVYHLTIIVVAHVLAYLSWHLIEKPAMNLKDWTPAPLGWVLDRTSASRMRLKLAVTEPKFSTTRFAKVVTEERLLAETEAAAKAARAGDAATPDGSGGDLVGSGQEPKS